MGNRAGSWLSVFSWLGGVGLGACAPEPVTPKREFVSHPSTGERPAPRPTQETPASPVVRPPDPSGPSALEEEQPDPATTPPPIEGRAYGGGIGSSCGAEELCSAPATTCFGDYPSGMCSKPCSRTCPDAAGHGKTFCVADRSGTGGICVTKTDTTAFPETGCREGYRKALVSRFNEVSKTAEVCLPETPSPQSCENEYVSVAGYAERWLAPTATTSEGQSCAVAEGLATSSVLNGVEFYREGSLANEYLYSSCAFAQTLLRMSEVLAAQSVTQVTYRTLYSCEGGVTPGSVSTHGLGNALDLVSFTSDGVVYPFANMRVPYNFAKQEGVLKALSDQHVFNHLFTQFCDASMYEGVAHADIDGGSEWTIDWAPHCNGYAP